MNIGRRNKPVCVCVYDAEKRSIEEAAAGMDAENPQWQGWRLVSSQGTKFEQSLVGYIASLCMYNSLRTVVSEQIGTM